ncbi:MAG: pyruvate kinase [candidate division Zixibacteria bacterium]|nr:pyruvate kinase [candidate division Zixibacteria bacterium]
MNKTKIICTLGPASADYVTLKKMMLAGMNVARLNFSHGSHKEHQKRINLVRELNRKYERPIKIMQDLEGYRIRVGRFKGIKPIELKKRQTVLLTNKSYVDGKGVIPFDYQGSLHDIGIGTFIYIDDGNIALRVKNRTRDYIKAEVVIPGILAERKGINIPDMNLKFKDLTEKDKRNLQFGVRNKVDFIAQSFVRNKKDMVNIREFIGKSDFKCQLIAKIENKQGIDNIDEILDVSDGVMVARGDMGVSLPIYEVPVLQKMIIHKCNQYEKIVITATQMLESMTEHIRPTRAEVSDVANAVLDGSDYVMLSGETAIGKHPVETVKMMSQIIKFTERFQKGYKKEGIKSNSSKKGVL